MTMLDIYGARTGSSLRAAIALSESGLPFRAISVGTSRGPRTAAFKSLNPLGKLPVLIVDEGGDPWAIAQSGAIMFEVAKRAGDRLLPASNRARAQAIDRLFYFLTDVIAPSQAGLYLSRQGQTMAAEALDALVVERLTAGEAFLCCSPWMGGARFSLADIVAYTLLVSVHEAIDRSLFPAMMDWFARVSERPAVRVGLDAFD